MPKPAPRLNPCHTRVASLQRSHSVLHGDRRGARCAVASNAVYALCALCHRLERHAEAIILNMHKDRAL